MILFTVETARGLLDNVALLLLATALASVLIRRLDSSIHLLAGQGLLLAAAATVVAMTTGAGHAYFAIALTLVVKALVIPGILLYALREVRVKQEVETVISPRLVMPVAVGMVLVGYYVAGPLTSPDGFLSHNALPTAVSMLLIGLLSMLTRKKALSQVVGIVAMENGLYLMAVVATHGLPLAVELGVSIDLVTAVLVMGMYARQIHRIFDTINTDYLQTLRG